MELSRPTVRGRTACGNRTVSRTGKTGMLFCWSSKSAWRCSGVAPIGSMSVVISDAIEFILDINTLTFDDQDAQKDAVYPYLAPRGLYRKNRAAANYR